MSIDDPGSINCQTMPDFNYRRSGNLHVKNYSRKKLSCCFAVRSTHKILLTVDGSTIRHRESKLSLVLTLWLSGVVVDRAFTSGGVDVRGSTLAYSLIITAKIFLFGSHYFHAV